MRARALAAVEKGLRWRSSTAELQSISTRNASHAETGERNMHPRQTANGGEEAPNSSPPFCFKDLY